jgi:putative salt-induced outer membrane protein YdiY
VEQYGETDNNNNVTNTVNKTYVGLRLGEKLEHKLTDTTKLWQSVEYIPAVDRFTQKYVLTFEAGIDTAITKKWSLRVMVQDIYNSEPGGGNKKNDMRLLAGTAYKF